MELIQSGSILCMVHHDMMVNRESTAMVSEEYESNWELTKDILGES